LQQSFHGLPVVAFRPSLVRSEACEKTHLTLETLNAVLVAEAKGNWNVFFRMFLAFPFAVFLWKVVIWDKVLGWGVTDDLSPDLWNLMMIVFSFFFVYETAALFKRR
tara:strand:- start:856 stop:1176 length:321 start_codon:yes stop_codon:yes gene_type:complete